jgi:hypothetical protein
MVELLSVFVLYFLPAGERILNASDVPMSAIQA